MKNYTQIRLITGLNTQKKLMGTTVILRGLFPVISNI